MLEAFLSFISTQHIPIKKKRINSLVTCAADRNRSLVLKALLNFRAATYPVDRTRGRLRVIYVRIG
jgi:hypothetical protein